MFALYVRSTSYGHTLECEPTNRRKKKNTFTHTAGTSISGTLTNSGRWHVHTAHTHEKKKPETPHYIRSDMRFDVHAVVLVNYNHRLMPIIGMISYRLKKNTKKNAFAAIELAIQPDSSSDSRNVFAHWRMWRWEFVKSHVGTLWISFMKLLIIFHSSRGNIPTDEVTRFHYTVITTNNNPLVVNHPNDATFQMSDPICSAIIIIII